METKAFARYTLFLLLAVGILITASSVFTQKGREEVTPAQVAKGVTPAQVTKACKDKKPGDTVKLGGQDITCQTPTPQVAKACQNKKPGAIVRVAKDATCQTPEVAKACQNKKPGVTVTMAQTKQVACPPACCYINGCIHPQNRDCL